MAEPDLLALAALNNAEWSGIVTRAHGLRDLLVDNLWSSPTRTPDLYPDAVTLRSGVPTSAVLAAVDTGAGCSVKDSFADLDLGRHGFRVLLEGRWVGRDQEPGGPARPELSWTTASTEAELEAFGVGWGSGAGHPFRPPLLRDPRVRILTGRRRDGGLVAGAALNDTGPVTGISNVFGIGIDPDQVWADLTGTLARWLPGRPLVGWSDEGDLAAALGSGFRVLGPLRVWLR